MRLKDLKHFAHQYYLRMLKSMLTISHINHLENVALRASKRVVALANIEGNIRKIMSASYSLTTPSRVILMYFHNL